MLLRISICMILLVVTSADKDDKKWVWKSNNRDGGRSFDTRKEASARYEIYENEGELPFNNFHENQYGERPFYGNRPSFSGSTSFGPDFQQIGPNKRPGLYGPNNYGSGYGQGQSSYYPDEGQSPGILTGPVPSWEKEGPYKEFDHCKCAAKFNCNSPGISYGHCDVGKQYCCYSDSKRGQVGGPPPSKPVHSIENGILVGPGGPLDVPGEPSDAGPGSPGFTNYQRPGVRPRPGGYFRPGQQSGFGIGAGGGGLRPGFGGLNSYSPENGILVGPGGPFDRPNRGYEGEFSPRVGNANKD